jgi:hypothetical protein
MVASSTDDLRDRGNHSAHLELCRNELPLASGWGAWTTELRIGGPEHCSDGAVRKSTFAIFQVTALEFNILRLSPIPPALSQ